MKTNTKINYTLIFVLLGLFGCDDELTKINEDIDNPVAVPVDQMLIGVQRDLSSEYSEHTYRTVNKIMNYTEQPTRLWDEYLDNGEERDFWNAHYNELRNLDYIINNAKPSENNHKAAALIIKSWGYYLVSALHGDIPYTEAGRATEDINLPAYDRQETVFKGILEKLEEANDLLGSGGVPMNGDILLGGDEQKWKKFANSLRVRVLIAQSKQIDPSAELQRLLSDPEKYPLMESNEDQPAFTYSNDRTYPNTGGFHVENTFMGEEFIEGLIDLSDQRILAYASPAPNAPNPAAPFVGIAVGTTGNVSSDDASLTSPLFFASGSVHALQTVWMSYAELQFLLAEAAERGWISGGTDAAKTYYNKGIEASYNYQKERVDFAIENGVSANAMASWSAASLSTAGVNYTGDTNEKLELIGLQKYIALFNDMESYLSWKRTGIPKLTTNPTGPGAIPMRYKYPVNENTFNKDNVNAANAIQGADERNTLMWILK